MAYFEGGVIKHAPENSRTIDKRSGTRTAGAAPQPREYPERAVSSVLDDTLEAQPGGRVSDVNNDNGSGKNSRQQP